MNLATIKTEKTKTSFLPCCWFELIVLLLFNYVFMQYLLEVYGTSYLESLGFSSLIAGNMIGLIMAICLLACVYYFVLHKRQLTWESVGVRLFSLKTTCFLLLITIGAFVIGFLSYDLAVYLGAPSEHKMAPSTHSFSWSSFTIAFVGASVVSPIYEEIFYRGLIYGTLRTCLGKIRAILISSMIFSLAHLPYWNYLFVTFCMGIIFALIYEKTKSTLASAFVHSLLNLTAIILSFNS